MTWCIHVKENVESKISYTVGFNVGPIQSSLYLHPPVPVPRVETFLLIAEHG